MKPDLEDFEDLNDEIDAPRSRAMSWLVLGVAVIGFASLAYYAYHSGSESAKEGDMLLVSAEPGPMKTAPANPGGEEFPNKDKTIYDVITPQGETAGAHVEKMLPEPQQPVVNPTASASADHEDDDVDGVAATATAPAPAATPPAAPAASAPVPAAAATAPAPTTTYVNKNLAPNAEDNASVARAPIVPSKPEAKAPGEPTMVNEKPATKKAPEAAPKKIAKPVEKKVASEPAANGGGYKVQLGAYASEAEAQGAWKKIVAAHAGVITGGPTVVKAEVNGKTFYRLRAGNYASASAAKAVCAKLGGQACFPAK